jgi:hypothetical protein
LQEVVGLAHRLEQGAVEVLVVELVDLLMVRAELEGVRELPAEMQAVDRIQVQLVVVAEFSRV